MAASNWPSSSSSGSASGGIQSLVKAIEKNPNDASARRALAYALYESGNFSDAANQFAALSALTKLSPGDSEKYIDALVNAKRDREATFVMENRLVSNRYDTDTRIKLAKLYAGLGLREKACRTCRTGMKEYYSINDFKRLKDTLVEVENQGQNQNSPSDAQNHEHIGG